MHCRFPTCSDCALHCKFRKFILVSLLSCGGGMMLEFLEEKWAWERFSGDRC